MPNNTPTRPPGRATSQGARAPVKGESWRLLALPLLAFFVIPIILLFTRTSPADLLDSLRREQVYLAIAVSLRTTLLSLGIILLAGTPLAYWLGRYEFRYRRLVDTLIDLPTTLPPSVAGVALLVTFGRRGPVGGWLDVLGVQVAFTQAAVVLAQVFIAAPFYVHAASAAFGGVEAELEQAAQLDGASRWQVFRYVMLPLSRSGLVGGAVMSWARALGEFGATILFAGNLPGLTQTMPTAIYLGFEVDIDIAVTLSVILTLAAFGVLWLVRGALGRR